MPRLRRNEWNFSAVAATEITDLLQHDPEFVQSPLGRAEPEMTELRGARRLDLVIFSRENETLPIVTGELKVPWSPEGRTPHASALVEAAHGKASRAGALYFITWNIRRVVVWKTDYPGVELPNRVVYDSEMVAGPMRCPEDLDNPTVAEALQRGIRAVLAFLTSLLTGPPQTVFLPLDRLFIARLESALDYPIDAAVGAITQSAIASGMFKAQLERWMREEQGWLVTKANFDENVERAARFACYVLVNRLCFYNALRKKYSLRRLTVANDVATAAQLQERLTTTFSDAKRSTGDYETVFDGDFGDRLPFLSDDAIDEWRALIRQLDRYDFAHVPLDVIGAMYEQLIRPEERHRYGQHYTQPAVVDLINAFALRRGDELVLDPGCGGGTFLVRSYARKRYLKPSQTHTDLLSQIYGCDILAYACHLSTINLAIRDLIDDDNFPRIHHGDFLKLGPGKVFCEHPVRIQAGGLPTERQKIKVQRGTFDAIVGNPPYISARVMATDVRARYNQVARREWSAYNWSPSSDIYTYFWTHATTFLKPNGILALITQSAWLDVEYGIPIQLWMLQNFRILAVMESEAEPWFTDARVATAVTILQKEPDAQKRDANPVRFVQFRYRLESIIGAGDDDQRLRAVNRLRDELLEIGQDTDTDSFRVRVLRQRELDKEGRNESEEYVGDKWGRYIRSTNRVYSLQRENRAAFIDLQYLSPLRRGITTNCDDFFLVADITKDSLTKMPTDWEWRERFGVSRRRLLDGALVAIQRSDGFQAVLEKKYTRPIVKTARDFTFFATSRLERADLAVILPEDRAALSELADSYVRAGEREGWQRSPSFQSLRNRGWFSLRDATVAPVLFIKTMQYTPLVLLNDGEFLANQRLYELQAPNGIDPNAFAAVLNSTVFAAERYAGVKALGREAAIDVEVFTARRFRTPDIKHFKSGQLKRLETCMGRLIQREVGPMLEEELVDTTISVGQRYIDTHPIGPDIWPKELKDRTRQEIDAIVLAAIGVPSGEIEDVRASFYNEMTAYTRRLRRLELEAQLNRIGSGGEMTNVRDLAHDVWDHLVSEGLAPCPVPDGFIARGVQTRMVQLPNGRAELVQPGLFEEMGYAIRVGATKLTFETQAERDYCFALLMSGIRGVVKVPTNSGDCDRLAEEIKRYVRQVSHALQQAIADLTSDHDLQLRIFKEGMRRILEA
jgi:type I restriction-modification system DNA methylase subunit